MAKQILYIMCGPAGSGKSTWARGNSNPTVSAIISRDKIRFSMVNEDEQYFSKETQVYNTYCNQIAQALDNKYLEVYADATHLSAKTRIQLLDKVFPTPG
jgi:predicted kinase